MGVYPLMVIFRVDGLHQDFNIRAFCGEYMGEGVV